MVRPTIFGRDLRESRIVPGRLARPGDTGAGLHGGSFFRGAISRNSESVGWVPGGAGYLACLYSGVAAGLGNMVAMIAPGGTPSRLQSFRPHPTAMVITAVLQSYEDTKRPCSGKRSRAFAFIADCVKKLFVSLFRIVTPIRRNRPPRFLPASLSGERWKNWVRCATQYLRPALVSGDRSNCTQQACSRTRILYRLCD